MTRTRPASVVVVLALLLAGLVLAWRPGVALANPNEGEARNLLREGDRVYSVVAGEADGSATVQNAANLGFLRGVNGILDASFTAPAARRRGSAVGAFVGIPLPWQIAALGFGYQYLWPVQPGQAGAIPNDDLARADEGFNKASFALAIPFERWVRGFSVGLTYSRLFSRGNYWAAGVNQVDVGVSWRANRVLALGLVARGLNQPRVDADVAGVLQDPAIAQMPIVLDPEVALRPFGKSGLELALGTRISTAEPAIGRFAEFAFQPRGRVLVNLDGVRVFAEAERFAFQRELVGEPEDALRISAGLGFDLGHVGVAGGANLGVAGNTSVFDGGSARVRISQERYPGVRTRPRKVTRFEMSKYRGDRGTYRLVRQLDALADAGGGVVLLEMRGVRFSYAQAEEVREGLLRLRARGGVVVAYLQGGNLGTYFLASAADRIIAHPHQALSIVGMSIRTFYYGELLARLGARAEFLRIAEYKGTPDVYSRDTASEPVAAQRRLMLMDVWNHVLRLIARERGHEALVVDEWIDAAPHRPPAAMTLGIIDAMAWPDELDESLEGWLGRKVRIAPPDKSPRQAAAWGPPQHVAILYVDGDLVTGPSATIPVLGIKLAGSETLAKQARKLGKDPNVKAIVVRIDSRGGSVTAAQEIARELDLAAAKKPVVISFGTTAASGGYYVATAGDYIFADATTRTGSIGIFYPKVDLSGTLEKLSIGVDIESFGQNATLRSWWKPYSQSERETAMRGIQEGYDVFVERVARARSMTPEQVDRVARGRVWSGVRAVDEGLVDAYGGLREAVIRARRMAGMRADEGGVREYPPVPGPLDQLRALFGLSLDLPLGIGDRAPTSGAMALLPLPLREALTRLPAALWIAEVPEPLAIGEVDMFIE